MAEKKPTKKAILEAFRAEMGKCTAMTGAGEECGNWGIERVNERAYCGQHLNSVILKADHETRESARRARLGASIDEFLAWTAEHPSVHDRMAQSLR